MFVQTDNTSGNQVVAYHRSSDGSLSRLATYETGGIGGALGGSVVDHLASQGSLVHDAEHRLLFAVNAGSNTVTVFAVDGDSLRRVQIIPSGGTFPVSITVHHDRAYVLNARNGGSIQGYRLTSAGLRSVPAWHRDLHLGTSTDPEFLHTPGQVAFTPDGSRLVITSKSGGNSILVFLLGKDGSPAAVPVVSVRADSVPFGVTFDRAGRLVVADAGPNALRTYRLDRAGHAVPVDDASTGQMASCWVTRAGNRYYVSNAGSNTVSRFVQGLDARMQHLGDTGTGTGPVDSAVSPDLHTLYVQTGGVGAVDVFRIERDGSLTKIDTEHVPGAVGGEGIVAV